MSPQELSLFVTGVANALFEAVGAEELAVLAAMFTQLGDTLETLAAQREFLESKKT